MADTAKYTKGPWKLNPEEWLESGHFEPPRVFSHADPMNPKVICDVSVRDGATEFANGQLITAAPEMAEILLYCVNYGRFGLSEKTRDKAAAILKKAGVL